MVTEKDKFQLIGWVYLPLKYKFTASRAKKIQIWVFPGFSDEFRMQTWGRTLIVMKATAKLLPHGKLFLNNESRMRRNPLK